MTRSVKEAIAAGIAALNHRQGPDGSFPLWTRKGQAEWRPCGRLFSTAYIMIGGGRALPTESIVRALAFIRTQRRRDGVWEYDPAIHIPPDADSTACSLAALAIEGEALDLSGAADLLRSYWRPEKGPFRTWRAPGIWSLPERDDVVVNCNVVFALRLLGSPPTSLEEAAVRKLVREARGPSRYYCSPATIAHAACRAGFQHNDLLPDVIARPQANDLIGSLQWLCVVPKSDPELVSRVLAAQRADGAWPLCPWVTGGGNPTPYWGSAAVTTALAIEALSRYAGLVNASL